MAIKKLKPWGILLLSWILIFQIGLSSPIHFAQAAPPGSGEGGESPLEKLDNEGAELVATSPGAQHVIASVADAVDTFGAAREDQLPPASPDSFGLLDQVLRVSPRIESKKVRAWVERQKEAGKFRSVMGDVVEYVLGQPQQMDLAKPTLELPPVMVSAAGFKKQVQVRLNPEDGVLEFIKVRGDDILAAHRFEKYTEHGKHGKVIAFKQDDDFLFFVTEDGSMHGVSMTMARSNVFKGLIPVEQLTLPGTTTGKLPPSFNGHRGQLKMAFSTRGLRPFHFMEEAADSFNETSAGEPYTMGDLVVYVQKEDGSRTFIASYDRSRINREVSEGLAVLARIAIGLSAPRRDLLERSTRLSIANPRIDQRMFKTPIPGVIERALLTFTHQDVDWLLQAAAQHQTLAGAPRDRVRDLEEWRGSYERLYSQAKTKRENLPEGDERAALEVAMADQDFSPVWKELQTYDPNAPQPGLLKKYLTPEVTIVLAMLTTMFGLAGIASIPVDRVHDAAWVVYLVNHVRSAFPIYADSILRPRSIKNILAWSSLLIPVFLFYFGVGKAMGWTHRKAFVQLALKAFVPTSMRYDLAIANHFGRQTNAPAALRAGIGPTRKVRGRSEVGRQMGLALEETMRPAVNKPWASRDERQKRRDVLAAIKVRDKRADVLAWLLANLVVAQSHGIDLPDFALIQEKRWAALYSREGYAALVNNPEYQAEWSRLAEVLLPLLEAIPHLKTDLANVSAEEFGIYVKRAKDVLNIIKQHWGDALLATSIAKWDKFLKAFTRKAGNWGVYEAQFASQTSSTPFVEDRIWQQFILDWVGMAVQEATIGARADPIHHPQALMVSPRGSVFGNFSNGAVPDRIQQGEIYTISAPARYEFVYGQPAIVMDDTYIPVEYVSPGYNPRAQGFWNGVLGFMMGALNLPKVKVGEYGIKDLLRRLRFLQAIAFLDIPVRHYLAGRSWSNSGWGFGYTSIMGWWSIGLFWHFLMRGLALNQGKIAGNQQDFNEAIRLIEQGSRLGRPDDIRRGYTQLSQLFGRDNKTLPTDLQQALVQTEGLLNIPEAEMISGQRLLAAYVGPVVALQNALELKPSDGAYRERVQHAYASVRRLYETEQLPFDQMDARALLEYARAHPPVATMTNPWAEAALTFFFGAFPTTFLGGFMFVASYAGRVAQKFIHFLPRAFALYTGGLLFDKALTRAADAIERRKELVDGFTMAQAEATVLRHQGLPGATASTGSGLVQVVSSHACEIVLSQLQPKKR